MKISGDSGLKGSSDITQEKLKIFSSVPASKRPLESTTSHSPGPLFVDAVRGPSIVGGWDLSLMLLRVILNWSEATEAGGAPSRFD